MLGRNGGKYGVIVKKSKQFDYTIKYYGQMNVNAASGEPAMESFGRWAFDKTSLEAQLKDNAVQLLKQNRANEVKIEIKGR